ncbi:MAG: hypothetical protein U0893_08990 [Chloroflexota bacterium]
MLEQFTLDTFTPRVGEIFRVQAPGADPIEMALESVAEIPVAGWRPDDAARPRQPFSLLFLGPAHLILPQAIYPFEHDALGIFEIFIVPVGKSANGVTYEAVFS